MPDVRIVNEDNDSSDRPIAAQVRALTRANAQVFVQVNASGDIVNPGGGGAGGDGAIQDGVDSTIKATVLQSPTSSPATGDNPLLIQLANDLARQIGTIASPIGVEIVGGSVGSRISSSGDSIPVRQQSAWAVTTTGDVTLQESNTRVIGKVASPIGVQIVGGSGGGTLGVTGDVTTIPKSGQTWPVSFSGTTGVNVIGGSVGARISVSGDIPVVPSTVTSPARFPVSGDYVIRDGVSDIRATVRDYSNSNPLSIVNTNASGDSYNAGEYPRVRAGSYGSVNMTGDGPTLIRNFGLERLSLMVQNVGANEVGIGFDTSLKFANAGAILRQISGTSASGDGGSLSIDHYTGPVYGCTRSGSVSSVRYQEI